MPRVAPIVASTCASLAMLLSAFPAQASSPAPGAVAAPSLRLQTAQDRGPTATLFAPDVFDPVPASFHQGMLAEVETALIDNLVDFDRSFNGPNGERLAGGGDGSGGLALIAGILGFFPGFGLGHLITGDLGGFVLFFVIDIVIAAVFFVVFPVVFLTAGVWYLPGVIVFLIERVIEAFSAASSATREHYADIPATGPQTVQAASALSLDVLRF